MVDIAALGLSVDSAQIAKAKEELGTFAAAAKAAEQATQRIGTTSVAAAASANKLGTAQAAAAAQLQRQAALSTHALTNLSFQLNDVATMAAMGSDPMRILATQAGQFYQILATGNGGIGASLGQISSIVTSMITPFRLAAAAAGALGFASFEARNAWVSAQRELEIRMIGIASASGQSVASINALAVAAAVAGDATVGQARNMALAFAATGKIGDEISRQLVAIGKDAELVFGENMTEILAKAFADPAKGVEELNKQLGAFSAKEVERIRQLDGQNQKLAAQQLLVEGVRSSIEGATKSTSAWTHAWDSLSEAASRGWTWLGNRVDQSTGGGTLEQQIQNSFDRLQQLQDSNIHGTLGSYIDREYETYLRLNRELEKIASNDRNTKLNLESLKVMGIAERISPTMNQRSAMEADLSFLEKAIRDQDVLNKLSDVQVDTLNESVKVLRTRVMWHQNAFDLAVEDQRFSMQAITARTALEQAELAFAQKRAQLLSDGRMSEDQAVVIATMERNRVLKEAEEQQRRASEERTFSADQSIETARAELRLVGATSAQREREIELLRVKQQIEGEALRTSGDRNAYDRDHLKILEDRVRWQSEISRLIQQETINRELSFDRDQMGRSESEQRVYSRLDGMGMLTDGRIVGSQAEMVAQQVRFNEVMRLSQDMSKDFASGFIRDMKDGVSATEALGNALNKLADKFLDMAMDQAFSSLFAPFSKSVASGATGARATDTLTGWDATVYHRGGIAGDPGALRRSVPAHLFDGAMRYHTGGMAGLGPNEVPAILEKGERIIPRGGSAGGAINLSVVTNVDASGADAAAVRRLEVALAERDRALPGQIVRVVQDARQRGRA